MSAWKSRLCMGLLIVIAMAAHSFACNGLPNTPAAMLLFHGSAALVDMSVLLTAPSIISGKVLADSEILLLASILGNAVGWSLYMLYEPPAIYDTFMWTLTCAQWIRLCIVERCDDDYIGDFVVRGPDYLGGSRSN